MLPKAKALDLEFDALGEQMLFRKKELQRNGIPSDAEHAMVAAMNGKGDSPASCARSRDARQLSRKLKAKAASARTTPKRKRRAAE